MQPRTLYIAGTSRNAGKTLVSSLLLRSFAGMGAIKLTCCRSRGGCPRANPCGVCRALTAPFSIIQDTATLNTPGKDTARLMEAATGRVVWLQSREFALTEALDTTLSMFDSETAVLVEGNAAFLAHPPDLGLLVIGPGMKPVKSSVKAVLPFVSGVVLNTPPGSQHSDFIEGIADHVQIFSFDAVNTNAEGQAMALLKWVADRLDLPLHLWAPALRITTGHPHITLAHAQEAIGSHPKC